MKNFKTYPQFLNEGKVADKVKQQEEDTESKDLTDILIITDVDEGKYNSIKNSDDVFFLWDDTFSNWLS